jgi:endo-1,4-beta-D-glucanase Y/4-amino-4-deoxy-L-arabinose transferase-like glycosyltransferase
MKKFFGIIRNIIKGINAKRTIFLFLLSLVIAGTLHGYNMFHYPYFESDEGTYLSQAFSVKENGNLTPYVYWYDHPPLGWITIAAWIDVLNNDWNLFGSSLYTGRVLMWLLHLLQVSLVFFIAKRVTTSPWLAFLATLIFSVSPLTVYYQRRVLLDNVMTSWLLISVALLYVREVKLRHVLMSGFFYGLAFVTKITTVMFGPAFLYLLLVSKWGVHKGFRTFGWLMMAGSIACTWIIYAAIKTELFPSPTGDRVSLIGSLKYQASRGTEKHFWEAGSSFMENIDSWMMLDATYVYIVGLGLFISVLLALFSKQFRFFGLATILIFFFLIRGGVVIGFYVLPMLPFIAFAIVIALHLLSQFLKQKFPSAKLFVPLLFVVLLVSLYNHYDLKVRKYLVVEETNNQIAALRWVKQNLPEDATIMVDIYGMTELLDPTFENSKVFKNADWYFKVAKDPAIRFTKYRDDWRNFDYVLISHEMLFQSSLNDLPVVSDVIRNSQPVMKWEERSTSFIDVQKFISTNGDWAALYSVNNNTKTQLLYSWNYYRDNYIKSYGQVVDPSTGVTTSEGQAYAMLRAALMNDREAFKGVWLWTQHQLQHRLNDDLISWQWKDGKQIDSSNATDADLDMALALIFASKIFDEPQFLFDAQKLLDAIWEETVVTINGTYYLLPAEKTNAERGVGYLLNPSYFSPAHFKVFAEVDTKRKTEWLKLADDSYRTLNRLRTFNSDSAGLPPNWVLINQNTGAITSAASYIAQGGADQFGYDAFRTFWRVALDVSWYESTLGTEYLKKTGKVFEQEWKNYRSFTDVYYLNGARLQNNQNLSVASGILSAVNVSANSQVSSDIYNTLFANKIIVEEEKEYAYWEGADNYYDSNWIWFGLALFNDNLPNLWEFYK